MPRNNVIPFPASPPFAAPRKRGASSSAESMQHIGSNLPDLLVDVKLDIVRAWRRGVRIAWLAKMHQLSVAQLEAVLWSELGYCPAPQRRAA